MILYCLFQARHTSELSEGLGGPKTIAAQQPLPVQAADFQQWFARHMQNPGSLDMEVIQPTLLLSNLISALTLHPGTHL